MTAAVSVAALVALAGCGNESARLDRGAGREVEAANPFAGSYYGYCAKSAIIFAVDVGRAGMAKVTVAEPFLHGAWVCTGSVSPTGAARWKVTGEGPGGKLRTYTFTGKFAAAGGKRSGQGTCVTDRDPGNPEPWVAKSRTAQVNAGRWTVQRQGGKATYAYGEAYAVLGNFDDWLPVVTLVFKSGATGYACDAAVVVPNPGEPALGKPRSTLGMALLLSTAKRDWFRNQRVLDEGTSPQVVFSARQLRVGGTLSGSVQGMLYSYDKLDTARLTRVTFKNVKIIDKAVLGK